MKQIPVRLFGEVVAYAIVDDEDFDRIAAFSWTLKKNGRTNYAQRSHPSRAGTLFMHRDILNDPVGWDVDHVNHDGLDNRRENLRVCTEAQQVGNTRKRLTPTTSQFKGVSWMTSHKCWRVQLGRKTIGRFKDEVEAARAYDAAAREHFGEFAFTNF